MVNRYESPAQYNPLNTYVPIPFKEMMQAGLAKEQAYAGTVGSMGSFENQLSTLQGIDKSVDKKYLNETVDKVQSIINKYSTGTYDLSDAVVKQKIDNEIRQAADPKRLRDIATSYTNHQMYLKDRAYKINHQEYDPLLDENPANIKGGFDSRNGVFNYTAPAWLNPNEVLGKQLFGKTAGYSWTDPKSGTIYQIKDAAFMNKIIDQKIKSGYDNMYTRQGLKLYSKQRGVELTDANRDELARDYLIEVSKPYYQNIRTGYDARYKQSLSTTPNNSINDVWKGNDIQGLDMKREKDLTKYKQDLQKQIEDNNNESRKTNDNNVKESLTRQNAILSNQILNANIKEQAFNKKYTQLATDATKTTIDKFAQQAENLGLLDKDKFKDIIVKALDDPGFKKIIATKAKTNRLLPTLNNIYATIGRGENYFGALISTSGKALIDTYRKASSNFEITEPFKESLNKQFDKIKNDPAFTYKYADKDKISNLVIKAIDSLHSDLKKLDKQKKKEFGPTFSTSSQDLNWRISDGYWSGEKYVINVNGKEQESQLEHSITTRFTQPEQMPIESIKHGLDIEVMPKQTEVNSMLKGSKFVGITAITNEADPLKSGDTMVDIVMRKKNPNSTGTSDYIVRMKIDGTFRNALENDAAKQNNFVYLARQQVSDLGYRDYINSYQLQNPGDSFTIPMMNNTFSFKVTRDVVNPTKYDLQLLDANGDAVNIYGLEPLVDALPDVNRVFTNVYTKLLAAKLSAQYTGAQTGR